MFISYYSDKYPRWNILQKMKGIWKRLGKTTRFYFVCALVVLVVLSFADIFCMYLSAVPLEVSMTVLENVIRLDGVLFGFTAVMLSLVYRDLKSYHSEFLPITGFSAISFLSYLLSIFMSFSYLIHQNTSGQIFVPVILTCFGGLCSSIYIIMSIIRIEKKE